jgi:hypothetical protein
MANSSLLQLMSDRISGGLRRQSVKSCSEWALKYRVMGQPFPGPWSFEHHPWTRQMHDDNSEVVVGRKAAQMGFTEVALNRTFYKIDILGVSVLYVLPAATPDATDFSTARFDPALELSDHLQSLFSDVKNIGHKRAGSANLYIRGSRSRSQMKSVPAGYVIFDEFDEMNQANVVLGKERTSGQTSKQIFEISTPTLPLFGIDAEYDISDQKHFMFPCPACNRRIEITPECLIVTADHWGHDSIRDSHLVCPACKARLPDDRRAKAQMLAKGLWVPTYTNRSVSGYWIPQHYSCVIRPHELAISYLKAQTNPSDEQEYYNSKWGMPHAVKGCSVTHEDLVKAKQAYPTGSQPDTNIVTMGVDVGKFLHVEIAQWSHVGGSNDISLAARPKVLHACTVLNFEDLDHLMETYKVTFCVIDANPERRKAYEFACRHNGRVKLCFYGTTTNTRQITVHAEEEHTITVDRTVWLDLALGRFIKGTINIPSNIEPDYCAHMQVPKRIYDKDKLGNPVGRYVSGERADHYAHAHNYCEIALPLAADLFDPQPLVVRML